MLIMSHRLVAVFNVHGNALKNLEPQMEVLPVTMNHDSSLIKLV